MATKLEESKIREELDEIARKVQKKVSENQTYRDQLPVKVSQSIDDWRFGTGVTNILLTSAWYKHLHPKQDISICFISIDKGYNCRIMGEKFTVPLVSKFDIYHQFCSRNGGFQASRMIENQKKIGPLTREKFEGNPRSWDKNTFFDIMESINENHEIAKIIFCYLLEYGFTIKNRITEERNKLNDSSYNKKDKLTAFKLLTEEILKIRDPQFHKILVAAFMLELHEPRGLIISGLKGSRTGADARDKSPGDLWTMKQRKNFWKKIFNFLWPKWKPEEEIIEGIEVKDFTHTFGFQHISAAKDRTLNNFEIKLYTLVTTGKKAISPEIKDEEWITACEKLYSETGTKIRVVTFTDLLEQNWFLDFDSIIKRVSELLSGGDVPDIKSGTIEIWLEILNRQ